MGANSLSQGLAEDRRKSTRGEPSLVLLTVSTTACGDTEGLHRDCKRWVISAQMSPSDQGEICA